MERRAYVTGTERGLGLALTAELLERGYRVYAGAYHADHPELDELGERSGGRLRVLPLDVTDQDSVDAAAGAIAVDGGRLDLLINNAGLALDRSRTMEDPFYWDDMHAVMEVNAFGPLRVTRSVIDFLRASDRGVLVNISSIAGSIGSLTRTHQYAYTMSKAALNTQSKLIHNHFGPEGLTVLVVHPGAMPTLILGDPEVTRSAPVTTGESARGIVALAERTWGA
ncbi:MAG: SDR family NAD(P)-dependent oxidoreductase, partial [Spirochaetota bacterium]